MQIAKNEASQAGNLSHISQIVRSRSMWSFIAAAVLAAFYLVTSVYIASHRLLRFDELLTVHVTRLPHWATIWTALAHSVDIQPPLPYMVARIFDRLFGHSEVVVRLPFALAMVAGLLITFDCARRLTDGLHGLIALSVLTCSFLPFHGYDARPYAIYFMLSALALWVWTSTRDGNKQSAILFGMVIFLGVAFHYYFVLCLVPYALWEIIRWRPWQPLSPKLITGVVGVLLPIALLSRLILPSVRDFSPGYYAPPSLWVLRATFSNFFPYGLFPLALIMIWVVLTRTSDKAIALDAMSSGESVSWLFLCIPLAGFVLARLKTNAYTDRYVIGALPGIAVAFSCCLWRHFRRASLISLGIFLLLTAWGVVHQAYVVRHPDSVNMPEQTATTQFLKWEDVLRSDGKRFFLFPNSIIYLQAEYYCEHPDECAMLVAPDGLEYPHDPIGRYWPLTKLAQYYPLHFWKLDDLKKHAGETALIEPPPEVLDILKQAGLQVEVRFSKPLEVVYLQ